MLAVGTEAPAFTLPDQNGEMHSLSDYRRQVSMGVVRTTYLIDETGIIVKAFDKVKADNNPAQMLGELS